MRRVVMGSGVSIIGSPLGRLVAVGVEVGTGVAVESDVMGVAHAGTKSSMIRVRLTAGFRMEYLDFIIHSNLMGLLSKETSNSTAFWTSLRSTISEGAWT